MLRKQVVLWWFPGLLIVVVLTLYLPSLRFGLIWDDPTWYQNGAGQSAWQIFTGVRTYQFYRPLAILLNRSLVRPTGVIHITLAHLLQIGAHLLTTLISLPVLQALHFDRWHARLTALLFAVGPLAYQAVAWQAPQQPFALLCILVTVWTAHRYRQRRQAVFLGLSLVAYAAGLFFQESVLPFVFVFFWLAGLNWSLTRPRHWRALVWLLLPLGLAVIYFLIWLYIPRKTGVNGTGFQSIVLAYLLQGVLFPISHVFANPLAHWSMINLTLLFLGLTLTLAWGVWKWNSSRTAALSCVWILAGLLPIWAGLSWDYVQVGPRLFYPASLGIAALWAGWMAWAFSRQATWGRRFLGGVLLVGVLGISLQQWYQFQKLYQTGTRHLGQAVTLLTATPTADFLFINFPDRLELRPPLYPLGFWGLTLAPVVQDLSDYARAQHGPSGAERSLAAFVIGVQEREVWPYRVDLRGENSGPATLFQATLTADQVYLTEYLPDGALQLREVGDIRLRPASALYLARWDDVLQLTRAEVTTGTAPTLRLVWECLKPLPADDTIFVHLWQEGVFIEAQDGDSLGGLIPLSVWQAGSEVIDLRPIDTTRLAPGRYEVRIGVYDRTTGLRLAALGSDNQRFPEDEVPIGILLVP